MKIDKLPFEKTGIQKPVSLEYLKSRQELKYFYSFPPTFEGAQKAIGERKKFPVDRKILVRMLKEQYQAIYPRFFDASSYEKVARNIKTLKEENTFTVTTGHQLNIFGGPLYYIYKILSTVRLAQSLKKKHPECHFVPLYWMGSEDHDFEEINHFYVFGKKFTWDHRAGGSVGELDPSSLSNVLKSFRENLREKETFDASLGKIWEKAFTLPTLAQATIYWVTELFKDLGVVILNPDRKEFKEIFTPVFRDDLFTNIHYNWVEETKQLLNRYDLPVNPRKVNLFYREKGSRERIEQDNEKFKVVNRELTFTKEEMEKELEENPARFSPNVVLRPLYQEMILPNIAYVGGTNEIAYWLELRGIFKHHKVFYPQLVVRNSVVWIGKGLSKKVKRLELDDEELFLKEPDAVRAFLDRKEEASPFEDKMKQLEQDYQELMEACKGFSNEMKWPVVNKCREHLNELNKLKKDTRKLLKQRNDKDIKQLEKVFKGLFPQGVPQERYENFIPYYLVHGKDFLNLLLKNFGEYPRQILLVKE